MSSCTDDEIIKSISLYLEKPNTDYAVLINGEWGSGKTYFVKKVLIPELEKEQKKCTYISLYGLLSCSEISKRIFFETNKYIKSTGDKIKEINDSLKDKSSIVMQANNIFNQFKNNLPNLLETMNMPNFEIDYESMFELKEHVLFFDDLERCTIDICELLGYINNLTEHNNSKVVLIANEEKISKSILQSNLELKYIVVLNNNLCFDEDKAECKFNKDQLRERVNNLFEDESKYNEIKEKTIGLTITYKPNLSLIICNLINTHVTHNETNLFLQTQTDSILNGFNNKNCNNIRILIFVLDKFNDISKEIHKITIEQSYKSSFNKVLCEILENVVQSSITIKVTNKVNNLNADYEYDALFLKSLKIRFVEDYLNHLKLNSASIKSVVLERIMYHEDYNDPLYKLFGNYTIFNDEEINCFIIKIISNLNSNKYTNIGHFYRIINIFLVLESIGFIIDLDNVKNIIKEKIVDLGIANLIEPYVENYYCSIDIDSKFNSIREELNACKEQGIFEAKKKLINEYLQEQRVTEFDEFINKDIYHFTNNKMFFKILNIENLTNMIKNATNKELNILRSTFTKVYRFGNMEDLFQSDKENIDKFTSFMDIYEQELADDKMKKHNVSLIKNDLKRYKENFN